jgi:hypothetical protein
MACEIGRVASRALDDLPAAAGGQEPHHLARANKGPGRRGERAGPAARTSPMPASSAREVAFEVGDEVDGAGVVVQVDLAVGA